MSYRDALQRISNEVTILSTQSIRIENEPIKWISRTSHFKNLNSELLSKCPLVRLLQYEIYTRYYSQFRQQGDLSFLPSREIFPAPPPQEPSWDNGWTVASIGPNGWVLVAKGEIARWAPPGQYAADQIQVGSRARLLRPTHSTSTQPGYLFLFGHSLGPSLQSCQIFRVYISCDYSDAVNNVNMIVHEFDKLQLSFQMKAPVNAEHYNRRDAIVVYAWRRYAQVVIDVLRHSDLVTHDPTPLFTKRIACGIGIAEEPTTGESFGLNRCRIVAEGLKDAWLIGGRSEAEKVRAVEARWTSYGLSVNQPYLNPYSRDIYK